MNREGDGGGGTAKMTRKEARGARLQEQVKKEREQKQGEEPSAPKDVSAPNPIVDTIGNIICCCGLFDSIQRGEMARYCKFCGPLARCCCCVSGASS
jgi:hypothetical protein